MGLFHVKQPHPLFFLFHVKQREFQLNYVYRRYLIDTDPLQRPKKAGVL